DQSAPDPPSSFLTFLTITRSLASVTLFPYTTLFRSALELSARLKHRGAGQFKGDTLYWGKGSSRWFLKCYHKGDEINRKKSNYRSEEHTSELQSRFDLVCRLLLEKKNI